jgi:hypothetical protein
MTEPYSESFIDFLWLAEPKKLIKILRKKAFIES